MSPSSSAFAFVAMTDARLVEVRDLRVVFGGRGPTALDGVSLTLGDGVVGLVGANGAGKTTLLRCLAGLFAPTSGAVSIGGTDAAQYRRERALGYIPSQPRFPSYLTVRQFLDGLRLACGNPPVQDAERALVSGFELELLWPRRLQTLSLGQSRRVEIVAALIGNPDLILFDEPTNGLDPIAMAQLRQGILAIRRPGRTIVVSSHHLDELERLAERVLFLREGQLVGDHEAKELASAGQSIESRFLSAERKRYA